MFRSDAIFRLVSPHECNPSLGFIHCRLNAVDYGEYKAKVQTQITNTRNVIIKKSLTDRFIDAFISHVDKNPRYQYDPMQAGQVGIQ